MRKNIFGLICVLNIFVFASLFAQDTQSGASPRQQSSSSSSSSYNLSGAASGLVTVSQLPNLAHYSPVTMQGYIVSRVRGNYYTFRDSTGEVTVELEGSARRGFSLEPSRLVEISGKMERKRDGRVEVEAYSIRRL
jgi:uncharacterized protein (TIGR00156 family)